MKLIHIIPVLIFLLISNNDLFSQSITNFTLVNADTETDISNLQDGSIVNFTTLSTTNLNIRANTVSTNIGSVVFYLDGTIVRTENLAVYAMYGNSGANYYSWTPPLGTHEIKAIPYSGSNGSGTAGTPSIINVTFTNVNVSTVPSAPSNLQATANTPGVVNLTWTDNSNNELGFEIQSTDELYGSNPTWQTLNTTTNNTTSFSDNTLGTEPARKYRVRAFNSPGVSSYTSMITVDNKPAAPTNFTATDITTTSIKLNWDAPFGNDYLIEYTDDLSNGFQYLDALYFGFTDFTYHGFDPNTTYYFRINVNSQSQTSDWSTILVVTTHEVGYANNGSSNRRLANNFSNLDETSNISVYPIPTQQYLTVELEQVPSSAVVMNVLSIDGKIIQTITSSKKINQLDLSKINDGIYLLQINDGKSMITKKIILQK